MALMFVDGAPLREFAALLERLVRRPVADRTGLDGTFDIRLEFSSDLMPGLPLPPDAAAGPALGLKLQSERGPVTVIVIDEAELPEPD